MSLEGRVVLGSFRKVTEGTELMAFPALTSVGVRCPTSGQGKGAVLGQVSPACSGAGYIASSEMSICGPGGKPPWDGVGHGQRGEKINRKITQSK